MPNPFSEFGISDADVQRAINESVEVNAGIDEFVETELIPYARSISPVDSGKYAASWKLKKKAKGGKAVAGPTVWYSHLVEFGTGVDKKFRKVAKKVMTTKSWKSALEHPVETAPGVFKELGPDTPTPAFGVAQKVAEHFGGTYEGGIGAGVSDV